MGALDSHGLQSFYPPVNKASFFIVESFNDADAMEPNAMEPNADDAMEPNARAASRKSRPPRPRSASNKAKARSPTELVLVKASTRWHHSRRPYFSED